MGKLLVVASRFLLLWSLWLTFPTTATAQPALFFPWDYNENPWTLTRGPHDWSAGSQSGLDFDKDNKPRRVLSMFDGEVYFAGLDEPFYCTVTGTTTQNPTVKVRATDGSGWELWYLHLSEIDVNGTSENPVPVHTGDLLGISGKEGCSTAVHLHVELIIGGQHASWWGKSIMGQDRWDVSSNRQLLYSRNATLPPIHPMQTWTEDANNNHKTSFARGDPIRYVITVRNVRKDQATATFRFRAGDFFDWQGSVTVPSGLALYYSPSYIPTNASPGTYDYTVLITYTGPEIDCKYCNNTISYGLGTFRFTVR
jgi:murein DD-endopeptidase MepM/ murein hydrolase activator NlpD